VGVVDVDRAVTAAVVARPVPVPPGGQPALVGVVRVALRGAVDVVVQPRLHRLDLGPLGGGDPVGDLLHRLPLHPLLDQVGHLQRLRVVLDHLEHVLHIGLVVPDVLVGRVDLLLGGRRGGVAGGAGVEHRGRAGGLGTRAGGGEQEDGRHRGRDPTVHRGAPLGRGVTRRGESGGAAPLSALSTASTGVLSRGTESGKGVRAPFRKAGRNGFPDFGSAFPCFKRFRNRGFRGGPGRPDPGGGPRGGTPCRVGTPAAAGRLDGMPGEVRERRRSDGYVPSGGAPLYRTGTASVAFVVFRCACTRLRRRRPDVDILRSAQAPPPGGAPQARRDRPLSPSPPNHPAPGRSAAGLTAPRVRPRRTRSTTPKRPRGPLPWPAATGPDETACASGTRVPVVRSE